MKPSSEQWFMFSLFVSIGLFCGFLLNHTPCKKSEMDRYIPSILENASSCRDELASVRQSLEATQKVCREEVLERQRKCGAGLCQ